VSRRLTTATSAAVATTTTATTAAASTTTTAVPGHLVQLGRDLRVGLGENGDQLASRPVVSAMQCLSDEAVDSLRVVGGKVGVRGTLGTGTTGTANTVDVVFTVLIVSY
jgi:hypothetical protein